MVCWRYEDSTAKWVGPQLGSDGVTHLGAHTTVDGSVSYDFGHIKLKLAGFNLADSRAMIDSDGTYYVFQVGRQVQVTLEDKL
jgi:iron complex outermembrane recepter protein